MSWKKKRNSCFQFFPALVFYSVVIFFVNGECSNGETENAAAVELRRLILNEMRSSRNDRISIQIQNPGNHDEPFALNDQRLDSVDRRLDTLDQFVKAQSRLLISKLDTHDQYLRSHVESLESPNQNLGSVRKENGNNGSNNLETDRLKSSIESLNERLDSLRREHENIGNCSCDTDRLNTLIESLNQNLESLGKRNGNNGSCSEEADHHNSSAFPQDCADIRASGHRESGVYRIFPKLSGSFSRRVETEVYCDMDSSGKGWLVFQRRMNGEFNFEQMWREYGDGFGNLKSEFWLGNDMLHLLTSNKDYKLRIDMEDFEGEKRFAEYVVFSVSSVADKYRLTVSGYSGNAGDSFDIQNGMQFSTADSDNDKVSGNCALTFKGAWWYNGCHLSNLNGRYLHGNHTTVGDGVNWYTFRGHNHSLKRTEMKITPRV